MAQQPFIRLTQQQIDPQDPETQILFTHTVKISLDCQGNPIHHLAGFQNMYMLLITDLYGKLRHSMRDVIGIIGWDDHAVLPQEGFTPLLFIIHLEDPDHGFIRLFLRTGNLYLIAIQNEHGIFQFNDSQIRIDGAKHFDDIKESYVSILAGQDDINKFGTDGHINIETLKECLIKLMHAKEAKKITNKMVFLTTLFFCESLRLFYVYNKNLQVLMNDAPRSKGDVCGIRQRLEPFHYPLYFLDVIKNWKSFSRTFLGFTGTLEEFRLTKKYPKCDTNQLLKNLNVKTYKDMGGILRFVKFVPPNDNAD